MKTMRTTAIRTENARSRTQWSARLQPQGLSWVGASVGGVKSLAEGLVDCGLSGIPFRLNIIDGMPGDSVARGIPGNANLPIGAPGRLAQRGGRRPRNGNAGAQH